MEIEDTPQGRKVWQEKLSESLDRELFHIYENPDRAKELFMRVAKGDTLKEREAAAAEIARLAPLGRKEEPEQEPRKKETKHMPVPDSYKKSDVEPESKNLKAKDYKLDAKWKLTIADVNMELMEGREGEASRKKLVLSFEGREKRLVLNATNRDFLEARLGEMPNDWFGAEIILHRTTTRYGDDTVPALRITDVRGGSAPEPPTDNEDVPF